MGEYFLFKGTISGWSYFWRMWVQIILIPLLGLGLYLLAATSYKRASAMTGKNWLRVLATPTLPFIALSNILLANDRIADYMSEHAGLLVLLIFLFYSIIHIWLLFFDSKVTEHNG